MTQYYIKPWYVDFESMTEKELIEYFQDIVADEVISEQKESWSL